MVEEELNEMELSLKKIPGKELSAPSQKESLVVYFLSERA